MSTVISPHIRFDERGVAWIDDTNIKALEIALEHIAHGSSTDEIFDQHSGYLTMAQIHAALMHYYDHEAEYEAEINRQVRDFEAARKGSLGSPGRNRLRTAGKIA